MVPERQLDPAAGERAADFIGDSAREEVGRWTRELVDLALRHQGRYYLPYQLHASVAQFEAAYPEVAELRRVKQRHDPIGKFSNELWRRYL